MKQRNTVVCVFAHPDDEAFGPSGTIATFAKTNDVYILCATRGEAGENHQPERNKQLAQMREEELKTSAKLLGVKKVYFLDFLDGTLCNNLYHQIAEKVDKHVKRLRPNILLTFEPRGGSGHIDHVTISLVTSYVFRNNSFVKKLMYHCLTEKQRSPEMDNYFIYFPPGYKETEIDEVVDISSVLSQKLAAVKVHASQAKDMARVLRRIESSPKKENFIVIKK